MTFEIRALRDGDFFHWLPLFADYGDFYETPVGDERALLVWSWLQSSQHDVAALVAENEDGALVGFAHYRRFVRPLAGSTGYYIDDLFVNDAHRGHGIATALIEGVRDIARDNGASVVRWITAADNEEAQIVYDKVAERTSWVTYDLTL